MPHGGQHPAHLPVAALVDGQLDLGAAAALPRLAGRTCQADVFGGPSRAVFQMDAAPQAVQRVRGRDAPDRGAIGLGDVVARVGQLEQKVAVIRKKDQPLAVGVQPPDGAQHRLAADVHQLGHEFARMRVRPGRDDAARLVEGDVVAPERRTDGPAVEGHFVGLQIDFRPQFGHDRAVNPDAALGDPHLARPPRADSGARERFLQTLDHRLSSLPVSQKPRPPARPVSSAVSGRRSPSP